MKNINKYIVAGSTIMYINNINAGKKVFFYFYKFKEAKSAEELVKNINDCINKEDEKEFEEYFSCVYKLEISKSINIEKKEKITLEKVLEICKIDNNFYVLGHCYKVNKRATNKRNYKNLAKEFSKITPSDLDNLKSNVDINYTNIINELVDNTNTHIYIYSIPKDTYDNAFNKVKSKEEPKEEVIIEEKIITVGTENTKEESKEEPKDEVKEEKPEEEKPKEEVISKEETIIGVTENTGEEHKEGHEKEIVNTEKPREKNAENNKLKIIQLSQTSEKENKTHEKGNNNHNSTTPPATTTPPANNNQQNSTNDTKTNTKTKSKCQPCGNKCCNKR